MLEMYAPMVNSPITELATAIDDTQTTIEVVDGSKLPDAPNLAMIGLGENTETILYTQKDGNVLSGVTRGFQGVAKAWPQGTRVARFFAAYDQMAIQENIKTLDQSLAAHLNDFASHAHRHAEDGEDPITPEAIGAVSKSEFNEITGVFLFKDRLTPVMFRRDGYKTWAIHTPTRNSFIIVPEKTEGARDWDWQRQFEFTDSNRIIIGNVSISHGQLSPEGNHSASPGSIYLDSNGKLWVKTEGYGNVGWKVVQTV